MADMGPPQGYDLSGIGFRFPVIGRGGWKGREGVNNDHILDEGGVVLVGDPEGGVAVPDIIHKFYGECAAGLTLILLKHGAETGVVSGILSLCGDNADGMFPLVE